MAFDIPIVLTELVISLTDFKSLDALPFREGVSEEPETMAATSDSCLAARGIWAAEPKIKEERDGRLSSWKEIAVYLDRGVRTVQRWHVCLQLPVYKVTESIHAPVFAYKHELDYWVRLRAERHYVRLRPMRDAALEVRQEHRLIRERLHDTCFELLLSYAELALTLARTAATTKNESSRATNLREALKAQESTRRLAERSRFSEAQALELNLKLASLRAELEKLVSVRHRGAEDRGGCVR